MFLFIFESIGTSELILIGIVALIFLGPRKMPEIARKIGKMMAEFRSTAQDFKQTWEKEVNFEEEAKILNLDLLENSEEVITTKETPLVLTENTIETPEIREIDKESFDRLAAGSGEKEEPEAGEQNDPGETDLLSDKPNWL